MRFLDTNVLVYAVDDDELKKQSIARAIINSALIANDIAISTQVLQEFYWTASRKFAHRLEPGTADRALRDFTQFRVVQVDVPIILAATNRLLSANISFWDALVVEAALAAGATRLLTEDLQHGQVFDGVLRVEDPFR